ncbi:MAG: enoyl-CoA hydratase/isomerase family protein, partial [Alphaproteobacteria bacterium]
MKLSHLNEYADGKILAGVVEATGHIVINNPERHNAVSKDMYEAAAEQVQKMATDDNVRLLMLRGAGGKAFASGADISKFEKERNSEEQVAA